MFNIWCRNILCLLSSVLLLLLYDTTVLIHTLSLCFCSEHICLNLHVGIIVCSFSAKRRYLRDYVPTLCAVCLTGHQIILVCPGFCDERNRVLKQCYRIRKRDDWLLCIFNRTSKMRRSLLENGEKKRNKQEGKPGTKKYNKNSEVKSLYCSG